MVRNEEKERGGGGGTSKPSGGDPESSVEPPDAPRLDSISMYRRGYDTLIAGICFKWRQYCGHSLRREVNCSRAIKPNINNFEFGGLFKASKT